MEDLIPVRLTVRSSDGAISVQPLLVTRIGIAEVDGDGYKRIGQVVKMRSKHLGARDQVVVQEGFAWYYDEPEYGRNNGWERTKARAVQACLRAGGYQEAPENAANPGLF